MWQIEKKGPLFICSDELDGFLRVSLCQHRLIGRIFYNIFASHQRHRISDTSLTGLGFGHAFTKQTISGKVCVKGIDGHVIAVGNAKINVESMLCWEKW